MATREYAVAPTTSGRKSLCVDNKRQRYTKLEKVQNGGAKLGVDDVAKELHKVNQKEYTIHAIVFEPASRHNASIDRRRQIGNGNAAHED